MRCEEFRHRLNRLLDRRFDPDADWSLISHAGNCDACRHELRDQQSLAEAMRLFDPPEVPVSFAEHVVSVAAQQPNRRVRPSKTRRVLANHRRGLWSAVVSAAVLLVVGSTVVAFVTSDSSDPASERASMPVPDGGAAKPDRQDRRPGHDTNLVGAGESPPASGQQGSQRRVMMSAWVPLTSFEGIQSDEIPGVRPLVTSFDVTISLLKRTIPRHGNSTRKPPTTSQVSTGWQRVV